MTDPFNILAAECVPWFGLQQKNLDGRACTFYEAADGPVKMSAMKPGITPVIKFVQGPFLHTHCNNRLPIVIHAPAGYEIRCRIWRADDK